MKKVFILTLSCLIILLSFVFCFAESNPVILPIRLDSSTGYKVTLTNGVETFYSADSSPVYLVFYHNTINGYDFQFIFSENEGVTAYRNDTAYTLTNYQDGYYFSNVIYGVPSDYFYGSFATTSDLLSDINNSVFSTTFDLTYLVNGSVSWLTTFAQAVKNNALLLFIVLFIFIGIGIGLMKRFTRR